MCSYMSWDARGEVFRRVSRGLNCVDYGGIYQERGAFINFKSVYSRAFFFDSRKSCCKKLERRRLSNFGLSKLWRQLVGVNKSLLCRIILIRSC